MEDKCPKCGSYMKYANNSDEYYCSNEFCEYSMQGQWMLELEAEERCYNEKKLCMSCKNYDGDIWDGYCSMYPTMRSYMFGRKKKCKYYDYDDGFRIPESCI